MSVGLPDSIIEEYFDAITNGVESDTSRKETTVLLKRVLSGKYGFNILRSLAEIDSLPKEICIVFKGSEPRNVDFFRVLPVEELILSVKFYVISWTTLLDMLASLIKVGNRGRC